MVSPLILIPLISSNTFMYANIDIAGAAPGFIAASRKRITLTNGISTTPVSLTMILHLQRAPLTLTTTMPGLVTLP